MRVAAAAAPALLAFALMSCEPKEPRNPHAPVCPPPPEPERQSIVVGTIGKLHMAESRYPVSKLGDVMATFRPDVVLLSVRVDPWRQGDLEDASFEMTYLATLARNRAIAVEPIDWFRELDLYAPPQPVDPPDEVEIAKREAEIFSRPKLYTFEQANGNELAEKVFLAATAERRHRNGNVVWSRRAAWMDHLATDAVIRHNRPKKVLAYVDVFDRPHVDLALRELGYDARDPVQIVASANEVMAPDLPPEVLSSYKTQLGRVRERIEKLKGPEKAFWQEREKSLEIVIDKRAQCCVPTTSLGLKP